MRRLALRASARPLTTSAEIRRIVADRAAEIVSFDLFDTLVFRTVHDPALLFLLQGQALIAAELFQGKPSEWRRARKDVEAELAAAAAPGEVALADVYDQLLKRGVLKTEAARDRAMDEELALEAGVIRAHPDARALVRALRDDGHKVIVTSDTYLPPDFIRRIVTDLDLAVDEVVCSSETGLTKRHGTSFRAMAEAPGRLVHFGDNRRVDMEVARRSGVEGHWLAWPHYDGLQAFDREIHYLRTIGQQHVPPSMAAMAGDPITQIAARWAVVLYDYLRTLRDHARAVGATDIWLLSRDGESLAAVLAAHPEFLDGLTVRYARASRKFTHAITAAFAPDRYRRWYKKEPSPADLATGPLARRYYRELLTPATTHVMIVDMTSKGRLEISIRDALPPGITVSGFYFSLDTGHEASADAGQFLLRRQADFHQAPVETFSGFTEGTCLGAREENGGVVPVLQADPRDVAPPAYVDALRRVLGELCALDGQALPADPVAVAGERRAFVRRLLMYPDRALAAAMDRWPFADTHDAEPEIMTRPSIGFLSRLLARKSERNVWPSLGIYSAVPGWGVPTMQFVSQCRLMARDRLQARQARRKNKP